MLGVWPLTAAKLPALTEKLKELLLADEPRAVSILADLNPRKAAELITPHEDDFSWLTDLPRAAGAIARRAVDLKWHHDAEASALEHAAQSPNATDGYFRQYEQGRIYRSDDHDKTYAVHGSIAECHLANGGTGGELGFPRGEEVSGESLGTEATAQGFEGGFIASSSHGTYRIPYEIDNACEDWLGTPISAVETQNGVAVQRFEAGVVYSSDEGAYPVRAEVDALARGRLPISAEEDIASATTTGRAQRFKDASGL